MRPGACVGQCVPTRIHECPGRHNFHDYAACCLGSPPARYDRAGTAGLPDHVPRTRDPDRHDAHSARLSAPQARSTAFRAAVPPRSGVPCLGNDRCPDARHPGLSGQTGSTGHRRARRCPVVVRGSARSADPIELLHQHSRSVAVVRGALRMSRLLSAAQAGLILCPTCEQLARHQPGPARRCPRCGQRMHVRKPDSVARTSAYLIAAAILYIPANLLPIMHTATLVGGEDDTILSGVIVLLKTGSWPLAVLVFFASIMVPILKLLALSVLVLSIHLRWTSPPLGRLRLYRLVELIGRWSLLDIYVLTLLVALVQLRALATVEPRPGALAFAAVVVLTLFAARSFDPRLLWDVSSK